VGIEIRWGRDIPRLPTPALGLAQRPVQWVPEVQRPGRGVDHPLASSAEVTEDHRLGLHRLF
jgi:hypothetical protein